MVVCTVIPTHNRLRTLRNLLLDIQDQTLDDSIQLIPVVVIDGSTDGTIEYCVESGINHIIGSGDWWYTRSINEGASWAIREINPDMLMLTNDDVRLEPGFMGRMLECYYCLGDQKKILTTVFKDTKNNNIVYRGSKGFNHRYLKVSRRRRFDRSSEVVSIGVYRSYDLSGRCIFLSARDWTLIGGYDEVFKQYASDTEFGIRAMILDYKIYIDAENCVHQIMEETSATHLKKRVSLWAYIKSLSNPYSPNYYMNRTRINGKHSQGLWRAINQLRHILGIVYVYHKYRHLNQEI